MWRTVCIIVCLGIAVAIAALLLYKVKQCRSRKKAYLQEMQQAKDECRNLTRECEDLRRQLAHWKGKYVGEVADKVDLQRNMSILSDTIARFKSNSETIYLISKLQHTKGILCERLTKEELNKVEVFMSDIFRPFYAKVLKHALLSSNDSQLWALFQLGLSNRNVAMCVGIEVASVAKARSRLRKKLATIIGDDLEECLLG